jgi:hypothetical protein
LTPGQRAMSGKALAWLAPLLGLALALWLLGAPVWQVHDDAYYAMVAGGYGVAAQPSAEIPFMHPLVGRLALALPGPGYAALLAAGSLLALLALMGAVQGLAARLIVAASALPLLLVPQYTSVAGYLGVAGLAALSLGSGAGLAAALGLWLAAAALRPEMLILAVLIAGPLVLWRALPQWSRRRLILAVLGLVAILALLAWSEPRLQSDAIRSLQERHKPRVPILDYGVSSILTDPAYPAALRPSPAEQGLIDVWFFANPELFRPEQLKAWVDNVPAKLRLRYSLYGVLDHLKSLPFTIYPWLLVAAALAAWQRGRAQAFGLSLLIFIAAEVALGLMGRALPERVGLGLAAGLLGLAVAGPAHLRGLRGWPGLGVAQALAVLAALGVVHVGYQKAARDGAPQLREHMAAWSHEHPQQPVYLAAGRIPSRSLFLPWGGAQDWPRLVALALFYDHPQARLQEALQPCGAFWACLMAGQELPVYADTRFLAALDAYLRERHGRQLLSRDTMPFDGATSAFQWVRSEALAAPSHNPDPSRPALPTSDKP